LQYAPDGKPSPVADTTDAAKEAGGNQGRDILQQLKVTYTRARAIELERMR
jgi:hypothetical protein